MKPKSKSNPFLRSVTLGFTAAVVMAFSSTSLQATPYYWDIDGATPDAGGLTPSGTWSSAGTTWSPDSTGSTATAAYTTLGTDDLFFSAGTGATGTYNITLTTTQNAKSLNFEEGTVFVGLTNNTGTVVLASGLANSSVNLATVRSNLSLTGNQTWSTGDVGGITTAGLTTVNNANTTITRSGAGAGVVTTTGGLTLNSTSGTTLTLSGTTFANTILGGTTTFASGTSAMTVSGSPISLGGEIRNSATNVQTFSTLIDLSGTAGTFRSLNPETSGAVRLVFSGVISGTAGVQIAGRDAGGTGAVTLSGINTYTGNTQIGWGRVNLTNSSSLGTGTIRSNNHARINNISGATLTLANGHLFTGSSLSLNSLTGTTLSANDMIFTGAVTQTGNSRVAAYTGKVTFSGGYDYGAFMTEFGGADAGTAPATAIIELNGTATGTGSNQTNNSVVYATTARLTGGITQVGNASAFGPTGVVDLRGGALQSSSALTLANTTIITGNSGISGSNNLVLSGAFTQNNGGSRTLTVTNTGATTLSGTVGLNDGTSTTARTLTVSVASTAGATEISGPIVNTAGTGVVASLFTKAGTGLLKLSGTNTYTGVTTVTGGTLQLSGTGAINTSSGITVNGSGAKFLQTSSVASTSPITVTTGTVDGTGTVGAVTVSNNSGATVANGNGTASALTLGSLTFSGLGATNFTLAGGANTAAPLVVTGALTTSGIGASISLNATTLSPLVAGTTYNLISYGSYPSGSLADFTKGNFAGLSARQVSFANDTVNKVITFSYSGAADSPKWTGLDDDTWQAGLNGTNKNWKLVTAGTPTDFIQGDDVLFDDSATGITAINVTAANVSPATTTFNNSTLAYSLASPGAFGIAGTGTLVKNGSAALTINNSNAYSGGTTLNAGTLTANNASSTGTGNVTVNGGTLNLNNATAIGTGALTINGGALDNTRVVIDPVLGPVPTPVTLSTNNVQNWNGDFAFNGTTALNLGNGAVTLGGNRTVTTNGSASLTVGGAIGGSFGLTKSGGNTLILTSGASTFTGNVVVDGGILTITSGAPDNGSTGALGVGSTGKSITVNAGARLNLVNNTFGNQNNAGTIPLMAVNGGTLNTSRYTTLGALTLTNGAVVTNTATDGGNYQSFALRGDVTVGGSSASTITATAPTATTQGYHLGANTTFTVADVTGNPNADLTISAPLRNQSGDFGNNIGGLTKSGLGTIVLTGANTYTGVTTISGGTLQIGDGLNDGSIAGTSIVANATLAFNSAGTPTYANVISGGGTVSKIGAGTTTLSGANTFTGATSVTGGTLALTGANATSSISINGSGAKLLSSVPLSAAVAVTQGTFDGINSVSSVTVGAGTGGVVANGNGGSGTLTAGTLTFNGAGTVSLIPVGGASPTVAPLVVGTLNTAGTPGAITINANPITPFQVGTTYNLIGFTTFGGSANEFVAGPGFSARLTPTFAKTSSFITLSVAGDSPVWTGVNSGVWTTVANGNNGGSPNWATKNAHTATNFWANDAVEFNDTYTLGASTLPVTQTAVSIEGGVSPASTTFNNSGIDYTISSSDSTGIAAGSLTKNGTGKVTLTTSNTFAGPTTINAGTLQIGDGVTDGSIGSTASITNNGSLAYSLAASSKTVGQIISGTGSVTTSASIGTLGLTLSGVNTFSGGVNVNSGVLVVTNPSSLGAATNTLSFGAGGSGKLQLGGNSVTLGGLNSDSTAIIENTVSGNPVLTIDGTADSQFGGVIQNGTGTVLLTKTGTSKLTLLGDNTYTGLTSVTGGTLQIGNGASATGKLGNTAVNVSGGTLSLQTPGAISQNTLATSGTGTLVETVDNAISGTARLDVGAPLTLTRSNNYSGQTTITAPTTLTLTNPLSAGTGLIFVQDKNNTVFQFHVDGGGTIQVPNSYEQNRQATTTMDVNNNGDGSEDGVVQIMGNTKLGDGNETLNVTGGNGYSLYLTNVTYGDWNDGVSVTFNPTSAVLKIGTYTGGGANRNRTVTVVLNGTNTGNEIGDINQPGAVVSLTKSNTSTWSVTGTNTYTGPTLISAGTLQIGNGGTTGTLPSTSAVTDNATLAFNRSDALTVPNVISGTGAITQTGTGTTTLSGANTYTGETSVTGGVLSIPTAFLSDTAAVRVGAVGTLDLTTGTTDTVASFYIDGVQQIAGTWGSLASSATNKTARITGNGILDVTSGPITSAYAAWATLKGLTAGVNDGATQDPDNDGTANALEFVLGGNPLASDTSILPVPTVTATDFIFTFNRADESEAEIAAKFQYGTTLAGWSDVTIGAASAPADGNGVIVDVNEGAPTTNPDIITVTVPRTNAAAGKLFGRLNVVK